MNRRTVAHLGNAPTAQGGIATVIRNYCAWPWSNYSVRAIPSYAGSPFGVLESCSAARALRLLPKKSIVHVHLSQRGSFLREGLLLTQIARRHGHATVTTVHGSGFVHFYEQHPTLVRRVLQTFQHVLVLNESAARTAGLVVTADRVTTLPNAVDVADACPISRHRTYAVFAGEVGTRKGVDVLLAAWARLQARLPGAELLLAGDDPGGLLQHFPSGVTHLGPLPQPRIRDLLQQARVAVLPSRAEGLPMFLLEAMAQGVPIVATPVGGIPDLLSGGGGCLVPVGDVGALAEVLHRYLSDSQLSVRDGVVAHKTVRDRFSAPVHQRVLEAVYASLH